MLSSKDLSSIAWCFYLIKKLCEIYVRPMNWGLRKLGRSLHLYSTMDSNVVLDLDWNFFEFFIKNISQYSSLIVCKMCVSCTKSYFSEHLTRYIYFMQFWTLDKKICGFQINNAAQSSVYSYNPLPFNIRFQAPSKSLSEGRKCFNLYNSFHISHPSQNIYLGQKLLNFEK